MSKELQSYKYMSRRNWGKPIDVNSNPCSDEIAAGALQRIAESLEVDQSAMFVMIKDKLRLIGLQQRDNDRTMLELAKNDLSIKKEISHLLMFASILLVLIVTILIAFLFSGPNFI